jgi:hypothetical protein
VNAVSNFLLGCGLGALLVACISVPFLAPWPIRVRYLAATPLVDPWIGLTPEPRFQMRAVTLASVEADQGQVELTVDELGARHHARSIVLTREACAPGVVAELDGWSASNTPLLMVIEEDGSVHLFGPRTAVTNLALAGEKVR